MNCINAKHLLQKRENIDINTQPVPHLKDGGNLPTHISLESLLEGYLLKDKEMDSQIQAKAKQISSLRQNLFQLQNATNDNQEYRDISEADMVQL